MVAHAFNLGRQKQADLCEFEASLDYRASSRTARATQRNPVSKRNLKMSLVSSFCSFDFRDLWMKVVVCFLAGRDTC